MTESLGPGTVGSYLVERGVIERGASVEVSELGGGISSVVLDVRTPNIRLVVKQPLGLFRVPDEWRAKRERVLVETAALELARRVIPGSVPSVVDLDPDRLVVTVAGAPTSWRPWKEELLAGLTRTEVAERVGSILRALHSVTDESEMAGFRDPEIFAQQRVDPYYVTTMSRRPELAEAMRTLLDRMLATKTCIVHGDWSPKNVLCGPDSLWVIDWEITHAGDPAFDVAFMTNHLMLKAIHRPDLCEGYRACADAFWSAYGDVADPGYVLGHTGALMVARVDGKSPAEYLTPREREVARSLGSSLLTEAPDSLDTAWMRFGR